MTTQTYGIISAMDSEIQPLIDKARIEKTQQLSGLTFHLGSLEEQQVVLVQCGIGKVNAALASELLCVIFNVDVLINVGVAGTFYPGVTPCDIVVGTQSVQYDMDCSLINLPIGEIPEMGIRYFDADKSLSEKAYQAALNVKTENINAFKGMIATADQFNSQTEISGLFEPYAVEMEGAAIAQVAHINNKPHVIIRGISNYINETGGDDYDEFLLPSIQITVDTLLEMLRNNS